LSFLFVSWLLEATFACYVFNIARLIRPVLPFWQINFDRD
jgi:hypothetical protein